MLIEELQKQHKELLAIAGELGNVLDVKKLEKDGGPAAEILQRLSAALIAHLALEDQELYPKLSSSDDKDVQAKAKSYVDEMGGIGEAYLAYAGRWSTGEAISADASGFITQTAEIFEVLTLRIEREESGLFPMLSM